MTFKEEVIGIPTQVNRVRIPNTIKITSIT